MNLNVNLFIMDLVSGSTLHMEKDGSHIQLGEFVKEKGT